MGVVRKEESLLIGSRCSSYSWLLLMATKAATADTVGSYTLNHLQSSGLASIIELAGESDESDTDAGMDEEERRACIEQLVRAADAAFTHESTEAERAMMWNVDEGIDLEAAASLRRRVASRLAEQAPKCDMSRRGGFTEASALRRAAHALVNSCLSGRSAHFKTEQSIADQFVSLVGPTRFWMSVCVVVALAVGGACAALDWLVVENVLGPRSGGDYRACQCQLCERRMALGEKIGSGGFGAVWRCKEPEGVVLKLVEIDLERDVNALRLALDEAKHLLELKHEHVVSYYDMFVHRDLADLFRRTEPAEREGGDESSTMLAASLFAGRQRKSVHDYFCIAMEDCQGGTLLDHVASGVPFPLDVVCCVVQQCASALEYVHERGIVHRDVKLENVFIKLLGKRDRFGRASIVKIGDFGLAVRTSTTPAHLRGDIAPDDFDESGNDDAIPVFRALDGSCRSSSAIGGTEAYQSPECFLANEDLGPAVDAWALGCALYEMATCVSLPTEPPFLGQLVAEAQAEHVMDLVARLENALEVSAVAHAAVRDQPPRKKAAATRAVAGLRQLFQQLLSREARDRPTMRDVGSLDFLKPFAQSTLQFFASNSVAASLSPPLQSLPPAQLPVNTNRALRAKSMAQHTFASCPYTSPSGSSARLLRRAENRDRGRANSVATPR